MSRRFLAGVLLACGMFGCAPEDTLPPAVRPPTEPPNTSSRTSLGLLHDGRTLRVGDESYLVDLTFARPPGASSFRDLPQGFDEKYRARGWEGPTQSFGCLYYDNTLILAMHTESGLSSSDVQAAVKSYSTNFGEPTNRMLGARTSYYFWVSSTHRLMVYAQATPDGDRYTLTAAVGDSIVMDSLRMNPELAISDRASIESLGQVRKG